MRVFFVLMVVVLASVQSVAQKNESHWIGAVQYRPIIPLSSVDGGEVTATEENLFTSIEPKLGHSFGVLIRRSFTDRWSVETGIAQIRRNYNLYAIDTDTNFVDTSDFGVIQYQIPIQGLYYVRLTRDLYMNILAGFSFDFFPTDVATKGERNDFTHAGFRREWVQMSLLTNVGWEYRTQKSGYFYLGVSIHRPFNTYMFSLVNYNKDGLDPQGPTTLSELNGNFISLDLRYFFPISDDDDEPTR